MRAEQPPSGTAFFEGTVTCLSASAEVALLRVQTPQFGPVSIRVTDNAGLGEADLVESTPASDPAATGCSVPEPSYIRHDRVTSGDVAVVDASALPTDKRQCKDGGWRAFGTAFRNQGQCVAFVQRAPKP